MSAVHILRTRGYYLGQVRGRGCRIWRNVARSGDLRRAGATAVRRMASDDKRARVLFVPEGITGAYYEPSIVMEISRR